MTSLYPIADVDECMRVGATPVVLAQHWASLGIRRIQVRAKSLPAAEYLSLLREFREKLPQKVEVFANDRPDLAQLAACFGVHVGQSDLPVELVQQTFPDLNVGVSTHDLAQLTAALRQAPSYVAYGPVFRTSSKNNPEPCVGVSELQEAYVRARAAGIPLVAIGGITERNVAQVAPHCDWIATIGALTSRDQGEVTARYVALTDAIAAAG